MCNPRALVPESETKEIFYEFLNSFGSEEREKSPHFLFCHTEKDNKQVEAEK